MWSASIPSAPGRAFRASTDLRPPDQGRCGGRHGGRRYDPSDLRHRHLVVDRRHDDAPEFTYQVDLVSHPVPLYAKNTRTGNRTFYRAEIFMATGSTGRDIFGWSSARVITDILDAYEQHLAVLAHTEGLPGVLTEDGLAPSEWSGWGDED